MMAQRSKKTMMLQAAMPRAVMATCVAKASVVPSRVPRVEPGSKPYHPNEQRCLTPPRASCGTRSPQGSRADLSAGQERRCLPEYSLRPSKARRRCAQSPRSKHLNCNANQSPRSPHPALSPTSRSTRSKCPPGRSGRSSSHARAGDH